MASPYADVLNSLRIAYDGSASDRDATAKEPWKLAERDAFLSRIRDAGHTRLLEVGAGTGQDSAFFAASGIDVVTTDASPAMVEHCRAKGLDAHVMDFQGLDFRPASFGAAYAMNCLLHVPNADLPQVLRGIRTLLAPEGLFFVGVYGRDESREGVDEHDWHVPPRFFSWRTDTEIQEFARESFDVVDFHVVSVEHVRFQSLTLRRQAG